MADDNNLDAALKDLRWLACAMHPAELVVSLVRGDIGWGNDAGGVSLLDNGDVELFFDDGAGTARVISRAVYLGALARLCLERGCPAEHDAVMAILANPASAAEHPAADRARASTRCARLVALLEERGWERHGDELRHPASGSAQPIPGWADHVEALRAALVDQGERAGASALPAWTAYQRSMLSAIDALLAEEAASRAPGGAAR